MGMRVAAGECRNKLRAKQDEEQRLRLWDEALSVWRSRASYLAYVLAKVEGGANREAHAVARVGQQVAE